MSTEFRLDASNGPSERSVEVERGYGGAAGLRQPDDFVPSPLEVNVPGVAARMEELDDCSRDRIGGLSARALAQRARYARERQIVERGRPLLRAWNHVVDVERGLLSGLRQSAVLASVPGAVDDRSAEVRGDQLMPNPPAEDSELGWRAASGERPARRGRRGSSPPHAPRRKASRRGLACRATTGGERREPAGRSDVRGRRVARVRS